MKTAEAESEVGIFLYVHKHCKPKYVLQIEVGQSVPALNTASINLKSYTKISYYGVYICECVQKVKEDTISLLDFSFSFKNIFLTYILITAHKINTLIWKLNEGFALLLPAVVFMVIPWRDAFTKTEMFIKRNWNEIKLKITLSHVPI